MKISITSGVNAGIVCNLNGHRIWCDALHNIKINGLSTVTPERFEKMLESTAFGYPELIFYTHCCHSDHYSKKMNADIIEAFPKTYIALPEPDRPTDISITGMKHKLKIGDINLEFIRLTHEGSQYKNVLHYGCLISCEDKNILIAGDCMLCSKELEEYVADKDIYAAIMPFPWITLQKGRAFVEGIIKPQQLIINHLPMEDDDIYGYRNAVQKNINLIKLPAVHIFTDMLQETEI